MLYFAPHNPACLSLPTPCYCGPYCQLMRYHDHHLLAPAALMALALLCACERAQKKPDPSFDAIYTLPHGMGIHDDSCLDDAPSSSCN